MSKNRLKKWHKVLLISLSTLIIIAVAAAGSVWYYLDSGLKADSVKLESTEPSKEASTPLFSPHTGGFTMLVVGSDERDGSVNETSSGILNDVNLLVHVTDDQSRASVVSIPRDLMVEFPECTREDGSKTYPSEERQINASLSTGGLPCVVKVVEQLVGMPIPNAVMVNFNSVIQLNDIVGGVPVCLPSDLKHHMSDRLIAPKGDSVLKGKNALHFVRERKSIQGGGDAGRIHNQQVFIKNMLLKISNDGVLANPIKIAELMNAGLNNLTVSSSLADVNKLVSLALMVREIGIDNIDFYSLPVKGHPSQLYRLSLKDKAFAELMKLIDSPKVAPVAPVLPVEIPEGNTVIEPTPSDNPSIEVKPEDNNPTKNAAGYYCGFGSGW